MSAATWISVIAAVVFSLMMVYIGWSQGVIRSLRDQAAHGFLMNAEHDRCLGQSIMAVSDKHEANVLRLAALAWDTPAERHKQRVLAASGATSGKSVVQRWLEDRAKDAEERVL